MADLIQDVDAAPKSVAVPVKTKPSWTLIICGLVLAAAFIGGLVFSYKVGSKETVVGHPGSTETITTGSVPVTTTVQASQTTTKKGVPSDNLLQGLVATGAILIVVGVLYGRITTIKFPVGEIDLSPDEATKVATEAAQEASATSPQSVPAVTAAALAHARAEKRQGGGALTDADITEAVQKAAAGYKQLVGGDA